MYKLNIHSLWTYIRICTFSHKYLSCELYFAVVLHILNLQSCIWDLLVAIWHKSDNFRFVSEFQCRHMNLINKTNRINTINVCDPCYWKLWDLFPLSTEEKREEKDKNTVFRWLDKWQSVSKLLTHNLAHILTPFHNQWLLSCLDIHTPTPSSSYMNYATHGQFRLMGGAFWMRSALIVRRAAMSSTWCKCRLATSCRVCIRTWVLLFFLVIQPCSIWNGFFS